MAEEPNLAMSGNNRFSAFFSSLYHVVQESVGCTDFPLIFKIQDGVQHVVRAMNDVNGKYRFSGSDSSETLSRIFKNNCTVDYVGDLTRHAKVGVNRFKGGVSAHA